MTTILFQLPFYLLLQVMTLFSKAAPLDITCRIWDLLIRWEWESVPPIYENGGASHPVIEISLSVPVPVDSKHSNQKKSDGRTTTKYPNYSRPALRQASKKTYRVSDVSCYSSYYWGSFYAGKIIKKCTLLTVQVIKLPFLSHVVNPSRSLRLCQKIWLGCGCQIYHGATWLLSQLNEV